MATNAPGSPVDASAASPASCTLESSVSRRLSPGSAGRARAARRVAPERVDLDPGRPRAGRAGSGRTRTRSPPCRSRHRLRARGSGAPSARSAVISPTLPKSARRGSPAGSGGRRPADLDPGELGRVLPQVVDQLVADVLAQRHRGGPETPALRSSSFGPCAASAGELGRAGPARRALVRSAGSSAG